jgi:hypothetical protein
MSVIFLDRFDTVSDLRGKNRTYENIKAAVLAAGRFSCFDVETKKDGVMFTDLCNDPEIETFDMGYPWTGVRRRTKRATDAGDSARFTGRIHADNLSTS